MIFIMDTFNFNLQLYSAILVFMFLFVMFELLQSFFTRKQKQKKKKLIKRNCMDFQKPTIQYENREKSDDCILLNGSAV